jgi:phosphate transport system protein
MTQFEVEIEELKKEMINMWVLVESQMEKARQAMIDYDKDLAREVVLKEKKRVNAYELKIDRDCENMFALYQPVAVDLRFLLAVLKINNNLERIGDIADGIARYIIELPEPFNKDILEQTQLLRMFDDAMTVLTETKIAFETEDTTLARSIFKKDEMLDEINLKANTVVAEYIKGNPDNIMQALVVLSIIRKLERVGDQSTNIAEEIIFYVEAKVLKHHKKP